MNGLFFILELFLMIYFSIIFCLFVVFGKIINYNKFKTLLNSDGQYLLNPFDSTIVYKNNWETGVFIAPIKLFIFNKIICKYYVNNYGWVPIWSKTHKEIKKLYNTI